MDEEGQPLGGVLVFVKPHERSAESDGAGAFDLGALPPGPLRVDASKIGYVGAGADLLLADGVVAQLNLTLARIATDQARAVTIGPYTGYFQCRWAHTLGNGACGYARVAGLDTGPVVGPLWTQDKNRMTFQLEPGDWEEIVLEAKWTPTSFATTPKLGVGFSYEGGGPSHWFARSNATTSPARIRYVDDAAHVGESIPPGEPAEPAANLTLNAWMFVPYHSTVDPTDSPFVALAYEVRFDIWATVFYGNVGPADYTVLPP